MRPTVKDVAKLAGVSPKTVSNVINGVVFVRPETRARVESALAELDYVPNMSARGLRNGRSGMIALALPDLLRPYSAEIVHLVVELAHERGWGVQIEQTAAEPKREFELLSKARAYLVDGLILNPVNLSDSAVTSAGPLPPLVLIGDVDQDVVSQVAIDNVAAARDMTRHLLAQGCRRIAAVGTPEIPRGSSGAGVLGGSAESPGTAASRLRTAGYREALEEAGVPIDEALEISLDRWRPEGAATVVGKYLTEHELPDAFFCFTDTMASGALSALWSAGIDVPRQTLVAGFDNILESQFMIPPLTTIDFDRRAFVAAALDLLAERMADKSAPPRRVMIPHRVIERASTGH
ncbi:LacI family DNA-binding transcriptional regulator [Kribbella shirazensis]|uniref:DNA-binding LacI/PurR family transcriptional regulator n=1 Tax=Kribbella shirazensis TaxID=1105143 RepID=A0A7X5VFG8_9ACTN|nr:LacI family DNA-binding transcriptional regulator [Kribbella shirazensis]NIK59542.1 DNA-binding LacI/PurR family transcriptional regulator [Kribbella shirazensis]